MNDCLERHAVINFSSKDVERIQRRLNGVSDEEPTVITIDSRKFCMQVPRDVWKKNYLLAIKDLHRHLRGLKKKKLKVECLRVEAFFGDIDCAIAGSSMQFRAWIKVWSVQ